MRTGMPEGIVVMRKWKIQNAHWYAGRNCGYAQVEDLGCAVVCRKELWLCANVKIQDAQHIKGHEI